MTRFHLAITLTLAGTLLTGVFVAFETKNTRQKYDEAHTFSTAKNLNPQKLSPISAQLNEQSYARGLNNSHQQQSKGLSGLDESLGAGICIIDINNDNFMDVFVVGGSGHTRFYGKKSWWATKQQHQLFRNNGHGHFDNINEQLDSSTDNWGMGCASADLNNDGWTDLVVTSRNSVDLLINQQGNKFTSRQLWQNTNSWPTSIAISDIDNNGLLDIYIANYLLYDKTAKHFESNSGFNSKASIKYDPSFYSGGRNLLFINQGQLEFEERAQALNVSLAEGRTLSAHWFDANGDSYPDLLAINDSGSASQLLLNQNGLRFTKAEAKQKFDIPSHTRSAAIDDLNGDGHADIVITTALGDTPVILLQQRDASGERTWANKAWQTFAKPEDSLHMSGYGLTLADLNNDGNLDIFFSNGQTSPDPDSHYQPQGQSNAIATSTFAGGSPYSLHTQQQLTGESLSSRSAIKVDIDNDGDSDVLISNNNGPLQLQVNQTPVKNWLGINASRDLLKATVTTTTRQLHRFNNPDAFLGHHDSRLLFSFNTDETVQQLQLYWRNGDTQKITNPSINNYLAINQNETPLLSANIALTKQATRDYAWIRWTIIAGQASSNDIPMYAALAPEQKREWIELITQYKTSEHLAVLQLALNDSNTQVVEAAIQSLATLERSDTAHWLYDLFKSDKKFDRCILAEAYRHFFIEEEALTHRKGLAVSPLIAQLKSETSRIRTCTLAALSESKSPRAVGPIQDLIANSNNTEETKMAIYALGEIRRSHSFNNSTQEILDTSINESVGDDIYQTYLLAQQKSEGLLTFNNGNNASATTQILSRDSIKTAFLANSCTDKTPESLLSLNQQRVAGIFNICSKSSISLWANENKAWLNKNYLFFLNNNRLKPQSIAMLIHELSKHSPAGFDDFLHAKLINSKDSQIKLTILENFNFADINGFNETLKDIYQSKAELKQARILAGNILIHTDSKLVLQHAEEIFSHE